MRRLVACSIALLLVAAPSLVHAHEQDEAQDETAAPKQLAGPRFRLAGALGLGYAHHRVLGTAVNALAVGGALGIRGRTVTGYFGLRYERGVSVFDVGVHAFAVTWRMELPDERLRVVGGVDAGYFAFVRATSGEWIGRGSIGLRFGVVVDLVRFENGGALYADALLHASTFLSSQSDWGPSLNAGLRF